MKLNHKYRASLFKYHQDVSSDVLDSLDGGYFEVDYRGGKKVIKLESFNGYLTAVWTDNYDITDDLYSIDFEYTCLSDSMTGNILQIDEIVSVAIIPKVDGSIPIHKLVK